MIIYEILGRIVIGYIGFSWIVGVPFMIKQLQRRYSCEHEPPHKNCALWRKMVLQEWLMLLPSFLILAPIRFPQEVSDWKKKRKRNRREDKK